MTRYRLRGALVYYGHHVYGCAGGDSETCECGYADLLEKLEATPQGSGIRESGRGGTRPGETGAPLG